MDRRPLLFRRLEFRRLLDRRPLLSRRLEFRRLLFRRLLFRRLLDRRLVFRRLLGVPVPEAMARINWLCADQLAPNGTGGTRVDEFLRAVVVDPRGEGVVGR